MVTSQAGLYGSMCRGKVAQKSSHNVEPLYHESLGVSREYEGRAKTDALLANNMKPQVRDQLTWGSVFDPTRTAAITGRVSGHPRTARERV